MKPSRTPRIADSVFCALTLVGVLGGFSQSLEAGQDGWSKGFKMPGMKPGTSFLVRALQTFDDGTGEALYIGGGFSEVEYVATSNIAKWDGLQYSALGSGVNDSVFSFAVTNVDRSPVLVACGSFTQAGGAAASCIAYWNGSSWAELGGGANTQANELLAVGNLLYAGGTFTTAGGVTVNRIGVWDGTTWAPLGAGFDNGSVSAMAIFDDGTGPALYAAGSFTASNGVSMNRIAKWNGTEWLPLGTGLSATVNTMTVFDDGSGEALYVGGSFATAGGQTVNRIAKWDGKAWSDLDSGMTVGSILAVLSLAVHDDGSGSGPALYAAGQFSFAGATSASSIAKWDGQTWTALGSGIGPMGSPGTANVRAIASFDDGTGPTLHAGGNFLHAGGVRVNGLGKWNGSAWTTLGIASWIGGKINALTKWNDGRGEALYAGGLFLDGGSVAHSYSLTNIARWDGSEWAPLGPGRQEQVHALAVFDDGNGSALYAAGRFATDTVSKWNGTTWAAVGSINDEVRAMAVFDDGSGEALYAAGVFTSADGSPVNRIAKWDGQAWSDVGGGITGTMAGPVVNALAVFDDDGLGPNPPSLFAGGWFTMAGSTAVNNIARWDGTTWSDVGGGVHGAVLYRVHTMLAFEEAGGPALIVGGSFTNAGAVTADSIARWDGSSWSALAGGNTDHSVDSLCAHDDGNGMALYAGGFYTTIEGVAANRVAKWDGATWSALDDALTNSGAALALASYDPGSGPALYAGGDFQTAGGFPSQHFAAWTAAEAAPAILEQPVDTTAKPGETVVLSAEAEGSVPLAYQWRLDGLSLADSGEYSGATTKQLSIMNAQTSNSGVYDVLMFNASGLTFSKPAEVEVALPCPADIAPQPSGDGVTGVPDLLFIINNWGVCANPRNCPADIAPEPIGDDTVGVPDLLYIINNWGPCP